MPFSPLTQAMLQNQGQGQPQGQPPVPSQPPTQANGLWAQHPALPPPRPLNPLVQGVIPPVPPGGPQAQAPPIPPGPGTSVMPPVSSVPNPHPGVPPAVQRTNTANQMGNAVANGWSPSPVLIQALLDRH